MPHQSKFYQLVTSASPASRRKAVTGRSSRNKICTFRVHVRPRIRSGFHKPVTYFHQNRILGLIPNTNKPFGWLLGFGCASTALMMLQATPQPARSNCETGLGARILLQDLPNRRKVVFFNLTILNAFQRRKRTNCDVNSDA